MSLDISFKSLCIQGGYPSKCMDILRHPFSIRYLKMNFGGRLRKVPNKTSGSGKTVMSLFEEYLMGGTP